MDVQKQILNSVDELQCSLKDIVSWEKDMKRRESSFCGPSDESEDVPPVRSKVSRMDLLKSDSLIADNRNDSSNSKRHEALYEKERGNLLVKHRKWSEAIFRYTKAIECLSTDASFYANRAHCFLQMKKWREAETDCTIAIQLNPLYDKAYFRRALALKELNQYRDARNDFIEVLNIDPNNIRAQNEITVLDKIIINEKPVTEISVSFTSEAAMSDLQLAQLKKEKGNSFVRKKLWKSAIECYSEACNLYSEDPSFYLNRALCFLKLKEPHKTILDCIRVLELDPDNVKAYYRRALAYLNVGEESKAHDDLLNAFKLDPCNQAVQKDLDNLEKRLGVIVQDDNKCKPQSSKEDLKSKVEDINVLPRLNAERFLKLGGIQETPVRKAPHILSKKPLKHIVITKKNEKVSMLGSALEELYVKSSETVSDIQFYPKQHFPSEISVEDLEKLIDETRLPINNLQFMSVWDKLQAFLQLQYKFLKKVQAKNFPVIFQDALECYIFSGILHVLVAECIEAGDKVYEYLFNLCRVKRFGALLLFASETDKKNIELLLSYCEKNNEVSPKEFEQLKRNYYI